MTGAVVVRRGAAMLAARWAARLGDGIDAARFDVRHGVKSRAAMADLQRAAVTADPVACARLIANARAMLQSSRKPTPEAVEVLAAMERAGRDIATADNLFDAMTPVRGEVRTVLCCAECGRLFGRRYIPFGLGRGISVNECMCQCTSRNVPAPEVARRAP